MRETDISASIPMKSISDRYRFKESDRSKNANWDPEQSTHSHSRIRVYSVRLQTDSKVNDP